MSKADIRKEKKKHETETHIQTAFIPWVCFHLYSVVGGAATNWQKTLWFIGCKNSLNHQNRLLNPKCKGLKMKHPKHKPLETKIKSLISLQAEIPIIWFTSLLYWLFHLDVP